MNLIFFYQNIEGSFPPVISFKVQVILVCFSFFVIGPRFYPMDLRNVYNPMSDHFGAKSRFKKSLESELLEQVEKQVGKELVLRLCSSRISILLSCLSVSGWQCQTCLASDQEICDFLT